MADGKKSEKPEKSPSLKWPIIILGGIAVLAYYFSGFILAQWDVITGRRPAVSAREVSVSRNLTLPDPDADRPLIQPQSARYVVKKDRSWKFPVPDGVYMRFTAINPDPCLVFTVWVNDRPYKYKLGDKIFLPHIQGAYLGAFSIDDTGPNEQEFGVYVHDVRYGEPDPKKWYPHILHKSKRLESAPPGSEG